MTAALKLVLVRCPLCGRELEVSPSATVQHLACPKKAPRSHPPVYRKVEP